MKVLALYKHQPFRTYLRLRPTKRGDCHVIKSFISFSGERGCTALGTTSFTTPLWRTLQNFKFATRVRPRLVATNCTEVRFKSKCRQASLPPRQNNKILPAEFCHI